MGVKLPFASEVKLETGEIGDDFSFYYHVSEQTPSLVAVGVLVNTDLTIKSAGGLIIQLLPNATEEAYRVVEDIAAHLKPISQLLMEYETPADIVNALFDDYEELGTHELQFRCECSRQGFAKILRKLPVSDLQTMIDEDGGCEVVCRFCGNRYWYKKETLQKYIDAQNKKAEKKKK